MRRFWKLLPVLVLTVCLLTGCSGEETPPAEGGMTCTVTVRDTTAPELELQTVQVYVTLPAFVQVGSVAVPPSYS